MTGDFLRNHKSESCGNTTATGEMQIECSAPHHLPSREYGCVFFRPAQSMLWAEARVSRHPFGSDAQAMAALGTTGT